MCAHDAVAQKDYYPRLPEIPQELLDDDEETVKIVQLVKSNEPLVSSAAFHWSKWNYYFYCFSMKITSSIIVISLLHIYT